MDFANSWKIPRIHMFFQLGKYHPAHRNSFLYSLGKRISLFSRFFFEYSGRYLNPSWGVYSGIFKFEKTSQWIFSKAFSIVLFVILACVLLIPYWIVNKKYLIVLESGSNWFCLKHKLLPHVFQFIVMGEFPNPMCFIRKHIPDKCLKTCVFLYGGIPKPNVFHPELSACSLETMQAHYLIEFFHE